ncbi:MAG: copper resistance protein CopD [Phenylobacterium sp.]|uniref:copper homeostasis membrane protein CopD n=1 Tax=Phenylobacterium sp. TaxID=1871053 RepID=UPI0011F7B6B5|nr:copper homeostasis membrane protein CopD [Phenylobacterium sp.]TAJ68799.1 MAG: copper resistance protein CopD [Phenylobacterium sp.]
MDILVVVARLAQFAAGAILFGTPLFLIYGYRGAPALALPWPRRLWGASAAVLALGALVSLLAQTAVMAGEPAAAFDREMLAIVVGETAFGAAILVRVAAAVLALAFVLRVPAGRGLWGMSSGLGAVALASFAWTGHGAAEPGPAGAIHAAADVLHLLAAGVWLGALMALALLLSTRRTPEPDLPATHAALARFSGIGSLVVAALILTGLVNSWFLVGPTRIFAMTDFAYGWLLLIKLALFVGMLGMAASNRFHLTPALNAALARGQPGLALAELRRSITMEALAGLAVLGLVSVLGVLAPVSAQ